MSTSYDTDYMDTKLTPEERAGLQESSGSHDVKDKCIVGKGIAEQNLQDFSIEELVALCAGYGPAGVGETA